MSKFSALRRKISDLRDVSEHVMETVKKKQISPNAWLFAADSYLSLSHAKAFLGKAQPGESPYPKSNPNGIDDLLKHPEVDTNEEQPVLFDIEKTDDLIKLADLMRERIQEVIDDLTSEVEYSHYAQLAKDKLTVDRFDNGWLLNEIRKSYGSN